MGRKKAKMFCGLCGSPITRYRKGRKHKIYVCPKHGIIMTNPLPFLAALGVADTLSSAITGKGLVEHAGTAAGRFMRGEDVFAGDEEEEEEDYEDEYYEE